MQAKRVHLHWDSGDIISKTKVCEVKWEESQLTSVKVLTETKKMETTEKTTVNTQDFLSSKLRIPNKNEEK